MSRRTRPDDRVAFDGVLIVGAGLAGLSAALAAAPRKVLVITAGALGEDCASAWAQGGMAAALGEGDDPALHAADTLAAGDGLSDAAAVAILSREGPAAVRALAALGAPFDQTGDGGFALSLEAAHSHARVARVGGDGAGAAITAAAAGAVGAAAHVTLRQGVRARALITDFAGRVRGILAEEAGRFTEIQAPATILATGGMGGLWAITTNPPGARGEGVALAALAGAEILDPEFVQFHPTAMDIGADPSPLATEALRGEGARLVNRSGEAFMPGRHPLGDLAPRDAVARAVEAERRAGRGAYLDCRAAIGARFPRQFPTVFAACMRRGLDPRDTPIPIAPAAHYHMGGVAADAFGRTSLEGLWAAGEAAATGVHGANRLASNSLVEAAVFGARAGGAASEASDPATRPLAAPATRDLGAGELSALRRAMARDVGIVRDLAGLTRALAWVEAAGGAPPALPLLAARLVITGALERRESRGAHFRADFPRRDAAPRHTRIRLGDGAAQRRAAA